MAKKTSRRKPAKKKPTPKKASTALVKRSVAVAAGNGRVDAQVARQVGGVENMFDIGQLGLLEPKFTKAENLALSKAVDEHKILVKPTKHLQPYLPHAYYTRWLNDALGRGAWALVAVGAPKLMKTTITAPYVLHIHGKPCAFAWGEHEYHENNREQTYGDALEATVANALRRCCKRLGIGLEMWDRDFLLDWARDHAIQVSVKSWDWKDKKETVGQKWRRREDPPLPGEVGQARGRHEEPARPSRQRDQSPQEPPPHAHTGREDEKITDPQRKRLFAIAKRHGRAEPELKAYLLKTFKLSTSRDITRRDYETICNKLEAPGSLLDEKPVAREPDEILEADDIPWELER